jgi:hypothetical protein
MNNSMKKISIRSYYKFLEDNWELALLQYYPDKKFSGSYNPEFHNFLDQVSTKNEIEAKKALQPWLSILEQAIIFLSSLHIILSQAKEKSDNPELLSPWALIGAACAQTIAIRKLCLCGLDPCGKTILRSLIDSLNTCTIILYDPILRKRYQEAQDFDEANKFWFNYLRDKKVSQTLLEIYEKLGIDNSMQKYFDNWQQEEKQLLHQMVHSSYVAVAITSTTMLPNQKSYTTGIFGAPSVFSFRTLSFASQSIWLFSLVGYNLLIKPIKNNATPIFKPDPDEHFTKLMVSSRFVLDQLVRKYWKYKIV